MRIILAIGVIISACLASCTSCNTTANNNAARNTNSNENRPPINPSVPDEPKPSTTPDPNFKACNSYFPVAPGSQLRYSLQFSSGLQANVVVAVDQETEGGVPVFVERVRVVDTNGGIHKSEMQVRKYVCDNGRLKIIAEDRDNTIEGSRNTVQMHYVDPAYVMLEAGALKQGATWSYSWRSTFQNPNEAPTTSDRSTIANCTVLGQQDVAVPAGKYKVMAVNKKIGKSDVTEYYAAGIGLVKRVNGDGTTWDLISYSGLKAGD